MASFLSIFLHDEYGLPTIQAGNVATLCTVIGSLIRPVGGDLSDRFGGIRVLFLLNLALVFVMGGMTWLPPLATAATLLYPARGEMRRSGKGGRASVRAGGDRRRLGRSLALPTWLNPDHARYIHRHGPAGDGQRCGFPARFSALPREIGVLTGLVGAAGGLVVFILPNLLGTLKGATGSFSGAFLLFALAGLSCSVILADVSPACEREFAGRGRFVAESA